MKILAIHGLWKKSEVFNSFRRYFGADKFYAPDIDWSENYLEVLGNYIKKLQPDVIIGYSYGGYAVQRLFEENPDAARLCVLIAPVGPRGISWKGILGCFTVNRKKEKYQYHSEKISTLLDIFPGHGKVMRPIEVPVLVISGGCDRFISFGDAEKITAFHTADHHHYYDDDHCELVRDLRVIYGIKDWICGYKL